MDIDKKNFNKEEIKETIKSRNIDNQLTKENDSKQISDIIEEKKQKKKDIRFSIIKLIEKDLPLLQIMKIKEKDKKNYDKISFEFNKIFKIFKLHKKEKENKNNSNFKEYKTDRKIINKDKNKNINLEEVIEKLEIPPEIRTMQDIYLIRKYLKTTQVGSLFQNEIKPKGELYNKLLLFLSFQMKFKKIKKDEILFKIGNRTDYFYLIMEGAVEILKPMSKIHTISGYEYFLQLMNYRKRNEKYLYSLCIRENLRNFEIKTKDAELIPYIYITYKLDEIKNRYFVDFKTVLDLVNITPEELGLDKDKIHSNGYIFNKTKVIKLNMPIITSHELNIYKFLDDKVNKKEVILFQYEPFLKIGKNKYFGEASFSGKGVRNGTARMVEDCYFGYLDIQLYNSNFYEEKKAIFEKKVNFLYTNFFFGKISLRKFENQFFNWFISEEYKNYDLVYKENSPCHFIYFIEEGVIELTSTRTILEIQVLLEKLEERRLSMKEKGQKLEYNILNNDWFDLDNHVNKDQINKVLILGKNNILGLESFYYQIPFLTNARVISPKAKIIKIDNEHLYQILIRSSECLHELETRVHNKIKILTNRFFSLNNVKLMLIDNKITLDEKLKYENHLNEIKKESQFRIKSPFPKKKIEILKTININDEIKKKKLTTISEKSGSMRNISNIWIDLYEKNDKINNKDNKVKNKENNFRKKKKIYYNLFEDFPDFEEKKIKNRKMIHSAGVKKKESHSYDMKNIASCNMEQNMLKKVKNEIKSLQENKYFLTKIQIKTEENNKKEDDIFEKEDFLFKRKKNIFLKNSENKEKKSNISNLSKNTNNDIKNKDNLLPKSESFVFITKFDEKKKIKNILDENKINININNSKDYNRNYKKELNSSLPSIIKPFNNKNSFKCLSLISRNNNSRQISIDNNTNKSIKNLNINFGFNNHLIKSYSFVKKKFDNITNSQQNIFDCKEKFNIFNENNLYKKQIYINMQRVNKLKGLNEFGYPLKASYSFIPRTIKKNDLNLKMKQYQEYRKRLQRKIEEINY